MEIPYICSEMTLVQVYIMVHSFCCSYVVHTLNDCLKGFKPIHILCIPQEKYPKQLSNVRGAGLFCAVDALSGDHRDTLIADMRNAGTSHELLLLIYIFPTTCIFTEVFYIFYTMYFIGNHKQILTQDLCFCSINYYVCSQYVRERCEDFGPIQSIGFSVLPSHLESDA